MRSIEADQVGEPSRCEVGLRDTMPRGRAQHGPGNAKTIRVIGPAVLDLRKAPRAGNRPSQVRETEGTDTGGSDQARQVGKGIGPSDDRGIAPRLMGGTGIPTSPRHAWLLWCQLAQYTSRTVLCRGPGWGQSQAGQSGLVAGLGGFAPRGKAASPQYAGLTRTCGMSKRMPAMGGEDAGGAIAAGPFTHQEVRREGIQRTREIHAASRVAP